MLTIITWYLHSQANPTGGALVILQPPRLKGICRENYREKKELVLWLGQPVAAVTGPPWNHGQPTLVSCVVNILID